MVQQSTGSNEQGALGYQVGAVRQIRQSQLGFASGIQQLRQYQTWWEHRRPDQGGSSFCLARGHYHSGPHDSVATAGLGDGDTSPDIRLEPPSINHVVEANADGGAHETGSIAHMTPTAGQSLRAIDEDPPRTQASPISRGRHIDRQRLIGSEQKRARQRFSGRENCRWDA